MIIKEASKKGSYVLYLKNAGVNADWRVIQTNQNYAPDGGG